MKSAHRPCPICGRPATETDGPFCSRRCADIDLSRWLKGVYVVPGSPTPSEDEAEEGPPRPH